MDVVFSNHARHQMRERGISEDMVREALLHADRTVPQSIARTRFFRFVTHGEKRMLVVVVTETRNDTQTVITAFITSKVTKYIP